MVVYLDDVVVLHAGQYGDLLADPSQHGVLHPAFTHHPGLLDELHHHLHPQPRGSNQQRPPPHPTALDVDGLQMQTNDHRMTIPVIVSSPPSRSSPPRLLTPPAIAIYNSGECRSAWRQGVSVVCVSYHQRARERRETTQFYKQRLLMFMFLFGGSEAYRSLFDLIFYCLYIVFLCDQVVFFAFPFHMMECGGAALNIVLAEVKSASH